MASVTLKGFGTFLAVKITDYKTRHTKVHFLEKENFISPADHEFYVSTSQISQAVLTRRQLLKVASLSMSGKQLLSASQALNFKDHRV